MGIYDREYYRREGPSFLQSFSGRGRVCKWLILINVLVFVLCLMTRPAEPPDPPPTKPAFGETTGIVMEAFDLDPEAVKHGQVWRLLTYAFLHDFGPWHILFNMLFLWWFGHEIEAMYGSREFLIFYLVAAVLGGVSYTAWSWAQGSTNPCIGASGSVTAVMVLYAFHFPTRLIYFWGIIPIPIWLFVGFQVAQDTFIFASGMRTGVAVVVHLAGAAFAFGYYKFTWRLAPFLDALRGLRLPRARPRLKVYRDEPPTPIHRPSRPQPEIDEHLEAQVDAVLEKVARTGRESLTEREKELLVRASEVYKRKQQS